MVDPTNSPNSLNSSQEIQAVTGLKAQQFADLVRIAQLIDDPAGSVAGRVVKVDWVSFGVPLEVVDNLKVLGTQYRHASPYVAIEQIWQQLTPATRNWLFENRNDLWRLEEVLPAFDEDQRLTLQTASILLTWVFNSTGGSVWSAIVLHTSIHYWSGVMPILPEAIGSIRPFAIVVLLLWILMGLVVWRGGATHLAGWHR